MLIVASTARGLAALAMVFAVLDESLWVVQGLHLMRMGLGAFTDAAARATLPRLVAPARLARANALLGASWSATFVVGIAAGGAITATWGVVVAFAVDAVTFFVAASLYATLPRIAGRSPSAPRTRSRRSWSALVPRAALAKVPLSIATGAGWILLNLTGGDEARPDEAAVAIAAVHVARAAGNGIAAVAWPRRWRASASGIAVANAVGLIGIAAFSGSGTPLVWAVVWGIGVGANWMTATTVLQATTPDPMLGHAVAVDIVAQALAQCVGGVIAIALAAAMGTSALVGIMGVAVGALAWAAIARVP
jgi:hypothetical protein